MKRIKEMLDAHPGEIKVDIDILANCIQECFDTAQICDICADACMGESDAQSLIQCIRLNLICGDICEVTGRMLSRQGGRDLILKRNQIETCIMASQACGNECRRHATHYEHCRLCAEACRRCEEACSALLRAVPVSV